MIISHEYRYVFIECPLTASWAIRHELCKHYGGTPVLHKHASFAEFSQAAAPDELSYFVFATVRNPLDVIVSRYCKIKTDHRNIFSNPERLETLKVDYADLKKHEFIRKSNANFEDYFRKYYKRPFSSLIDISSSRYDFVIRYECLQEDFSEVLRLLGIQQVSPVPILNKTNEKKERWETYYTKDIIDQAKKICGPFMEKWGYDFPPEWGDYKTSLSSKLEYYLVSQIRNYYLLKLRYSNTVLARNLKLMRAKLVD